MGNHLLPEPNSSNIKLYSNSDNESHVVKTKAKTASFGDHHLLPEPNSCNIKLYSNSDNESHVVQTKAKTASFGDHHFNKEF